MRNARRSRHVRGMSSVELVLVIVLVTLVLIGGWLGFGRQVHKLYCYGAHVMAADGNHECDPEPEGGGGRPDLTASPRLVSGGAGMVDGKRIQLKDLAHQAGPDEACFVAGTPVWTESGPRAIDSVVAGERVWARDPQSGVRSLRAVIATVVHYERPLVRVHLAGDDGDAEALTVTPEHPFWVDGRGFVAAGHLWPDALVDGIADRPLRVDAVEARPELADVFNLEVDEVHTYFAGRLGALVHNAYPGDPNPSEPLSPGMLEMMASQLEKDKQSWIDSVDGTANGLRDRLERATEALDAIERRIPSTTPTRDNPVTVSSAADLAALRAQLDEVKKIKEDLTKAEATLREPAALRGRLEVLLRQLAPPDPNAPPRAGGPPPITEADRQRLLARLGLPPNALDPTAPPPTRGPGDWNLESLAQVRLGLLQDRPQALQRRIAALEGQLRAAETRIAAANRALRVDLKNPADQAKVDADAAIIIKEYLNGRIDARTERARVQELVRKFDPDGDAETATQIVLRYAVQREQRLGDRLTQLGLFGLEHPEVPVPPEQRALFSDMAATVQQMRPELHRLGGEGYRAMLVEAMRPHWAALKKAGANIGGDGRWDLKGAHLGPKQMKDPALAQAVSYFFGPDVALKLADPERRLVVVLGQWAIPPGDSVVRTVEQWQKDVNLWVKYFRDRDLPAFLSSVKRANHWGAATNGIFWRGPGEDSPAQIEVEGNRKALDSDVRAIERLGAPPELVKQLLKVQMQADRFESQSLEGLQKEITMVTVVMVTAPLAPLTMWVAPAATPFMAAGFGVAGVTATAKTAIQIHYGDGSMSAGQIFYNNIVMDGSGAIITAPLALLGPAAGRIAQVGGASTFTATQVAMWTNVGVGGTLTGKSFLDAGKGFVNANEAFTRAAELEKSGSEADKWLARDLRGQAWSTIVDSTAALGWGIFGARGTVKGARDTVQFRQQMLQAQTYFEPLLLRMIDPSLKPGATLPQVEAAVKASRLSNRTDGRQVDAAFEALSRMKNYFGDPAWLKSPWHPIVVEAKVVGSTQTAPAPRALEAAGGQRPALPAPVDGALVPAPVRPQLVGPPRPLMLPAPRGPPATPADLRAGPDAAPSAAGTLPAAAPEPHLALTEVKALAQKSAADLKQKSATSLAELRAHPEARDLDRLQIGGGLSAAAVDGNTFLVDMRMRWPDDNSGRIFQSATELRRGFIGAGLGDPMRYVGAPNELVPLEAVIHMCDARALAARGYAEAKAEVIGYEDGRWVVKLTPVDGSAPVIVRARELVTATGLGPILMPRQLSGQWQDMRNAGKALFGDEVVSSEFTEAKAKAIDRMIIIGMGGTGISTAKSYLQLNPNGRVVFVGNGMNVRAFEDTSGAADFNARFLDRCEFYTGDLEYKMDGGKIVFSGATMKKVDVRWNGRRISTTESGATGEVQGDTIVSAIIRDNNRVPGPLEAHLGDAYRAGNLKGVVLFDGTGRYLGYRLITPDGRHVDVIGAAGRVIPSKVQFADTALPAGLVRSVVDFAIANPELSAPVAAQRLRAQGVNVTWEEYRRILAAHNLVTLDQRRAAATNPPRIAEMRTVGSDRSLVTKEGLGMERVELGPGNFDVGAGGSALTAASYRRAVIEARSAGSGPIVVSTAPGGGALISGELMNRVVGYEVIVDKGIVLFSRADGALRVASLAQVDAAKPGIYSLTLHANSEGNAYYNQYVNGQVVPRVVRVSALIAKVQRIAGRGEIPIDKIYVGACDSPVLLAQVARETGRWAFGPAGREAVTLSPDGRTVVMTVYDAAGKPLPADKAYVMVDPQGNRTYVTDPTEFFEAGRVRYDATRPLVPNNELRGAPPPANDNRAPAANDNAPAVSSNLWPAATPRTPKLVLQIPGSLMSRPTFGNAEIAAHANANFASAQKLDLHGQLINGTDLVAFQGYLDRLYTSSPAWRARVDAVKPPKYVNTQNLQAHEIVASFWKKGLPGIVDARQQLALEAYLYWAFDEKMPALQKAGSKADGVVIDVFSQSNLAIMQVLQRMAAGDVRTPGGVRLADQRIVVNGVAPAVGFQSLRGAIYKMGALPSRWTVTLVETADRATHIQHMIGTFIEIVFDPELTTAMRKTPARPNVRVVELAWPFNPRGALVNPRHAYDTSFGQFVEWMNGDPGARLVWSALLTGESPLTIESAAGMGSWIKLADSKGRPISLVQATKLMAERLAKDPAYRVVYFQRLAEARRVIGAQLATKEDPHLRDELARIAAWDAEVMRELKQMAEWDAALEKQFRELRGAAPAPPPSAPPTAPPPSVPSAPPVGGAGAAAPSAAGAPGAAAPNAAPAGGTSVGSAPPPPGISLDRLARSLPPSGADRADALDRLENGVRAAARTMAAAPPSAGTAPLALAGVYVDDKQQARVVGGAGGQAGLAALTSAIHDAPDLSAGEAARLERAADNEFARSSSFAAAR